MAKMDRIQQRFDELDSQAKELLSNEKQRTQHIPAVEPFIRGAKGRPAQTSVSVWVDPDDSIRWRTSATRLLFDVFGIENPTYKRFVDQPESSQSPYFKSLVSVFLSAKDDFEGGYLFDVRNLVHAEVFSDELDLSLHYLANDGKIAAAVVAGVVLETTMRQLCTVRGLQPGQLNKMNETLRADNAYTQIVWRQIQAWADIRNAAAHGNPDEFEYSDVTRMIEGIRDFVANHMS